MKRTLLPAPPVDVPTHVRRFIGDAPVYDSSCSPEAQVYLIARDGGFYLKTAAGGTLAKEAAMTKYFHAKGLGTEVMDYVTLPAADGTERDWLLTARVPGEDATHPDYLADPPRLCDVMGETLRRLHETSYEGCPVSDHTTAYLNRAKENYRTGNYDTSHFPDSFGYRSAEEAMAFLLEGSASLRTDTLLHGDFCLPNIMLDGWRFSGFIDVGDGGVGDRHVDLFWGMWTLGFNLGTDRYGDRFLDAYGRDRVDGDVLKVVAAAEVFG